jgi:AcrR family transcriptional regulator
LAQPLPDVKLSRKERELQFRMNLVLDAAEEVFSEASYAAASVEDIARRAEISVGTLYNLFASKEDIYSNVISRAQNLFLENVQERVGRARGPKDQIHAAVQYFFEHFNRYNRHFRLYNQATNGFQWELKAKLADEAIQSQRIFLDHLADVCQRGIDQGIFKPGVPADVMAVTIVGVAHSFLTFWLEREGVDLMSLAPIARTVIDRVTGAAAD